MLTAEQLTERQKALGASDIPALFNISPFTTAKAVWLEKMGMLEPWKGNPTTKAGNRLESVVLDCAEDSLGEKLNRDVVVAHRELPIVSRLDSQIESSLIPVEGKTTGILGPVQGTWGEPGSDEIPDVYNLQVHTQMLCTGAEMAYLFAMIGGRGIVRYEITRSEKICDAIGNRASDWWDKHIVRGIEPEQDEPLPLEVLKRIRREPESVIDFPEEYQQAITEWEEARQMRLDAEKHEKKTQSLLLERLGTAEAATLQDGRMLTYLQTSRAGYTVEPTTFRTLRIKKGD